MKKPMIQKCLAPEHCLKSEDGSLCPACPTAKETPSSGSERRPCYASLVAAYTALAAEPLTPEGSPTFYALSQEAQDAIVWAAMSDDDETPPALSESVQAEIREWASSHNAKSVPPADEKPPTKPQDD